MRSALLATACLATVSFQEPPPTSANTDPVVDWGPWHVIGAFAPGDDGTRLLAPLPIERALSRMEPGAPGPRLDKEFKAYDGNPATWRAIAGPETRRIDLTVELPKPAEASAWFNDSVAYLYRSAYAIEPATLQFYVGSDDGLRFWFNGRLLVSADVRRGIDPRAHVVTLELEPGLNHVLAKVDNQNGGWGFQMTPAERAPEDRFELERAIETSITRGVDYLLALQQIDGSWDHRSHDYRTGVTGFVVFALLRAGLEPEHPAIRRALEYLRSQPPTKTYALSVHLLAFTAAAREEDVGWIAELSDMLLEIQHHSGLYAYPGGHTDLSNTLFAAVALREAAKFGIEIEPEVWIDLYEGVLRCQGAEEVFGTGKSKKRFAGFVYNPNGNRPPDGSMTTAGLTVLAVVREQAGDRLRPRARREIEAAEAAGLAWLDHYYAPGTHPNGGENWLYFYLYGVERAGSLYGRTEFGGFDWYLESSDFLVRAQRGDGGWKSDTASGTVQSSLALLFLKRATQQSLTGEAAVSRVPSYRIEGDESGIDLRATGDTPLTMWVAGPQATSAQEVRYFAHHEASGAEVEAISAVAAGGDARFSAQHNFRAPGRWRLWCEIDSDAGRLKSPELEVTITGVLEEHVLEYADSASRNLALDARREMTASSESAAAHAPNFALDGRAGSAWLSKPDDLAPWIRIEFRKPFRAERILLSHARTTPADRGKPRPRHVRVIVNGADEYELEMPADEQRKAELTLPGRAKSIRILQVVVYDAWDGKLGSDSVGFGEIELQRLD